MTGEWREEKPVNYNYSEHIPRQVRKRYYMKHGQANRHSKEKLKFIDHKFRLENCQKNNERNKGKSSTKRCRNYCNARLYFRFSCRI